MRSKLIVSISSFLITSICTNVLINGPTKASSLQQIPDWDLSKASTVPTWDLSKVSRTIKASRTKSVPPKRTHSSLKESSVTCLAKNIYHEARGSTLYDRLAVAHVVMNRVKRHGNKKSVCSVVYTPYAFSWTIDKRYAPIKEHASYQDARKIATLVLSGKHPDNTHGATNYHTVNIKPNWSKYGYNKRVIGAHLYMTLDHF